MPKNKCISVYLGEDMLRRVDDYIDGINKDDRWKTKLSRNLFFNKLALEFFVKLETGAKNETN